MATEQVPVWIQTANALVLPGLAVAGGFVAWLQWRTNERKRRQDLFDRRFEFYRRALSAYTEFHSDRHGSTEAWEFELFNIEAGFLFGPDIVEHLKTYSHRSNKYDAAWFARPFAKYLRLY